MKKLLYLLIIIAIMATLFACNNKDNDENEENLFQPSNVSFEFRIESLNYYGEKINGIEFFYNNGKKDISIGKTENGILTFHLKEKEFYDIHTQNILFQDNFILDLKNIKTSSDYKVLFVGKHSYEEGSTARKIIAFVEDKNFEKEMTYENLFYFGGPCVKYPNDALPGVAFYINGKKVETSDNLGNYYIPFVFKGVEIKIVYESDTLEIEKLYGDNPLQPLPSKDTVTLTSRPNDGFRLRVKLRDKIAK